MKYTTQYFIDRAKNTHKDKYDYSLSNYLGFNKKIKIICPEHGIFEQTPEHHIGRKQGCKICKGVSKLTTEDFIEKAKKIHFDKYDYSLVEYLNAHKKVKIICSEHGVFEQVARVHLAGHKCYKCEFLITTKDFISNVEKIHNYKYDYSLVNYIDNKVKVKIICPEHGVFEQQPRSHSNGSGCPICKSSKGEIKIKKWLDSKNITYVQQHRFPDCKDKKPLPFDFYLLDYNICIEYDGIQHYEPINNWGGDKRLKDTKKKDNIKSIYCSEKNIKLLRIKYSDKIWEKMDFTLVGF